MVKRRKPACSRITCVRPRSWVWPATYVFSWTDDWHTGGHPIEDWAFGITDADRTPKTSYRAVEQVFRAPLPLLLEETPRVSVVVCYIQWRIDPRRVPSVAVRSRLSGLRGHRCG